MAVTLERIQKARERIAPYVVKTPLRTWNFLQEQCQSKAPFFLKLETFQNTGSFKARGAANRIMNIMSEGPKESPHFVAASAGNHAQAVAFVAGQVGVPATIVMPEGTPLVKCSNTESYGAKVILHGKVYDEAYQRAREELEGLSGGEYIHAYADEDVISGQGTCGLEIHEQLLQRGIPVDSPLQIVVPVGGGGLISGVATALKALRPKTKVFGVVGAAADAMSKSFKAGEIVASTESHPRTLAEGLAVKNVHPLNFELVQNLCEDIAVVGDDDVAQAVFDLMESGRLVSEGSGAAGVAALLAGKLKMDPDVPTVVVICGGNIDVNMISTIIERALVHTERWLSFDIVVEDRPGELARITEKIGQWRANVLDLYHDRLSASCAVGFTRIHFRLETHGPDHAHSILRNLKEEGYLVRMSS